MAEISDQQQQIFEPFPERGEAYLEDLKAKVEVIPKEPLGYKARKDGGNWDRLSPGCRLQPWSYRFEYLFLGPCLCWGQQFL
jgi:hypothetical protein